MYGMMKKNMPLQDEVRQFMESTEVELLEAWASAAWEDILTAKGQEVWAHEGKCACGRKTYLFGQCSRCLKEEAMGRHEEPMEKIGLDSRTEEADLIASLGRGAEKAGMIRRTARADWSEVRFLLSEDVVSETVKARKQHGLSTRKDPAVLLER